MERLLSPLGLTLLALVALIPGIWSLPLVDRDEPRFAHATVEMIEREEWAVPYFNDEYRFDKPPLTYWWMRANFEIFGINEMGARMHSAQASWIITILLFFFAKRLGLDRRMAFLAGVAWLTSLQVLIHSRLAVADMPLILFLVLTMASLHKVMIGQGKTILQVLLLSVWLALGFLAKGPLAYFIPQLALISSFAWFWWRGRKTSSEEKETFLNHRKALWKAQQSLLYALVPSLGLVAIWGIPALHSTEGAYFGVGIGKHVVDRGMGAMNDRFFLPVIYYLLVIIPFLLPWSAQLPATLKKAVQSTSLNHGFLLGWFVAPLLVFSCYATQLPHYILPGYPAFFLLLALGFREQIALGRFGRWVRNLALVLPALLGLVLFVIGLSQATRGKEAIDLAFMTTLLGGVFFSLAIMGAAAMRQEKIARFAIASAFAAFTLFFVLATAIGRNAHLTLKLREITGIPTGTLAAAGFKEPSLVWYFDDFSNKEKTGFWSFRSREELTPAKDSLTIVTSRRWRIDEKSLWPLLSLQEKIPPANDYREELKQLFGEENVTTAKTVSGWSPGNSSWIELLILQSDGKKETP